MLRAFLLAALALLLALTLAGPVAARSTCGPRVASAAWTPAGSSWDLHVRATRCGRATAARAGRATLAEAVARAGGWRPNVGRSSLRSQLVCHATFARSKPSWDLEGWRPDVGLLATVAAGCNPR